MSTPSNHTFTILWDIDIPERPALTAQTQEIIAAITAEVSPTSHGKTPWEINLLISDDEAIQHLNAQFRGKDKPTNVLAFPDESLTPHGNLALGDIIISYPTCKKEAAEQNKTIYDHLVHLLVHATVHLMGYDHQTEEEAEAMEAVEIRILARLNIANPYNMSE
jgi:probable rRNA maturation factor